MKKGSDYGDSDNSEGNDSYGNKNVVDEVNMVEDVDVDMSDFYLNIEKDVELVGGSILLIG